MSFLLLHHQYEEDPRFSWLGIIQYSSVTHSCPTLCDPMDCSMPSFPVHHQLLELTQTHVHWVGDAIQSFHPLSSPSPSALNLSQHQGLFQWVSSSHQMAKYWNFTFGISPSNEYSGLISLKIWTSNLDWFDLFEVQGTLKSLLRHHSSKTSILLHSALWSNPHMYIWLLEKTIAWIRLTLSAK